MSKQKKINRIFYKSIVIGMTLFLPIGIVLGILHGNLVLGLIAGNSVGFMGGLAIGFGIRKMS